MSEKPWHELTRLVAEYQTAEGSEREEAWNLLADFTLEPDQVNLQGILAGCPSP